MTRRLFLDFDGTLVDPRRRLYGLFRELAPECVLSFDEYWQLKRERLTQRELLERLGYADARVAAFAQAWRDKIEEPARLATDLPFPDAPAFLAQAGRQFTLYLVTARQHADRLAAQIAQLGWAHHFVEIAATGQRRSKTDLIRSRLPFAAGDVLAGDTEEDVYAGKDLGLFTVAVATGALDGKTLREFGPDLVVGSLAQLADILLTSTTEPAR